MAIKVTMPRLSDTMTEGTVATWLKKVGDKISEGDILAEIETDKATMEFESFNEGTLLHIGIQAGETAPVDSLLAIIGNEGEDISDLLKGGNSAKTKEKSEEKERLQYWLTANGLSYGRTLDKNGNLTHKNKLPPDNEKCRRVEFKIVTKTDELINEQIEQLNK